MTHGLPQALAAAGLALAAAFVGGGCADAPGRTADDGGPTEPGLAILAGALEATFEVSVGLSLGTCSAAVACPATVGDLAEPSLVTGLSCAFPAAWDGFLAFSRRLTCYYEGDVNTPSAWSPIAASFDPATVTTERYYSARVSADHSAYVNASQFISPLFGLDESPGTSGIHHCLFEAEGLIAATPANTSPREVFHLEDPPRISWRVVLEPASGGGFNCLVPNSETHPPLPRDFPASVTVGLPSDTDKGDYPVSFDYATIAPVTLVTSSVTHDAARVRYVLAETFPVPPTGAKTWAERDLYLLDGSTPLDATIDSTCARTHPTTGALEAIGVLLRKDSDGSMFGALEVLSTNGADRFECDRSSGACVRIPWSGTGGAASCLMALEPVAFVTAATYTPGAAYHPTSSPTRFASIADADAICNGVKGSLPGSYVAWLSDATHDADDATAALSARGLRTSAGLRVATSLADLLDGTLSNPIDRDASGTAVTTNLGARPSEHKCAFEVPLLSHPIKCYTASRHRGKRPRH